MRSKSAKLLTVTGSFSGLRRWPTKAVSRGGDAGDRPHAAGYPILPQVGVMASTVLLVSLEPGVRRSGCHPTVTSSSAGSRPAFLPVRRGAPERTSPAPDRGSKQAARTGAGLPECDGWPRILSARPPRRPRSAWWLSQGQPQHRSRPARFDPPDSDEREACSGAHDEPNKRGTPQEPADDEGGK